MFAAVAVSVAPPQADPPAFEGICVALSAELPDQQAQAVLAPSAQQSAFNLFQRLRALGENEQDAFFFANSLVWGPGCILLKLIVQCRATADLAAVTAMVQRYNDAIRAMSQTDKVSMLNYWANRLCGEAADRAMQIHGGLGYSRHKPFEHIYRHYRRYRITEGTEEIQMRRVAGYLFGFMKLDKVGNA